MKKTVRLARTASAMAHLATVVLLLVAAARQAPLAAGDHAANPRPPTCAAAPDVAAPQEHGGGGGGRRILDITHAVRPELPVLGSGAGVGALVRLKKSMANGSRSNLSELRMSVHTGTHVDAPGHMWQPHFDAGLDVDTLDLGLLNGPALLVDVPRHSNITVLTKLRYAAEVMESLNIPRGVRRVLFRTMNTDKRLMWQKESDLSFVGFTEDGAQWLVGYTDIKLVGVDYLSVASYEHMIPAHVVFLKSKVSLSSRTGPFPAAARVLTTSQGDEDDAELHIEQADYAMVVKMPSLVPSVDELVLKMVDLT
uniref:Cyclase family protein n=1 Tax=Oryza meridionalis TaxID=40149 RepID=A0A0E0E450_9ORYZ